MAPSSEAPEAPEAETASHASSPGGETPQPSGFFPWLRMLDVPRRSGWLGGVCAGLAERIGIDPILVRGVVVVLAVVGAPVVLLYAIAWALLPDESGSIHVEELTRGRVPRAVPGILAVFLLSFLPLTQGFWNVGSWYWGDLGWDGALVRAVWTAVILITVIVGVVLLARHASAAPTSSPATTDDRPETVPTFPADDTAGSADVVTASASTVPVGVIAPGSLPVAPYPVVPNPGEPPAMPSDASEAQLAEWKASQQQWQQQRAEWVAAQRRSDRERRQAEAHERALEASRASAERARIRRLTRPRARAGAVFLVLGLGLVAAGIATLVASENRETAGAAWVIGAATLVLVLGAGTVVLAFARRRSGALAFFSILAVLMLVVTIVLPSDRTTLPPGAYVSVSEPGRYSQAFGGVTIAVDDHDGAPRVYDIWQYDGQLQIWLADGATVRVDYTSDLNNVEISLYQGFSDSSHQYSRFSTPKQQLSVTFGDGDPDVIVKLWSHGSEVSVDSLFSLEAPIPVDMEPSHIERTDLQGELIDPLGPGDPLDPTDPTSTPPPTDGIDAGAGSGSTDTTQGVTP